MSNEAGGVRYFIHEDGWIVEVCPDGSCWWIDNSIKQPTQSQDTLKDYETCPWYRETTKEEAKSRGARV